MSATCSLVESDHGSVPSAVTPTTAERCVAFCRGVVLVTALAMLQTEAIVDHQRLTALDLLTGLAIVYVLGTAAASVAGKERPETQLPLLVTDMLLVTGIVYLAGGVYTEYYLLYYIPILQASVRLNFRDAIASALLSSGLYAIVGLSSGADTLIPVRAQLRAGTFAASATFMAAFFGLLSREARSHLQRSREMADLAAALAAKNRELEEKTRELAEAQAHLVARERLAAIGALAGSVGHELRNPLGVIRNAAYYVRKRLGNEDPDLAEMIDLMEAQVKACDRTIAALLDFARPDEAKLQPTDINSVIAEVIASDRPPPGVVLRMELSDELPPVEADAHQMAEVFGNILRNAVQAMGDSGELTVRSKYDPETETVKVEWSDTGPGIGPENLERIFDPLFTTKAKGIGLGLVVCKRLVERQGAKLTVESEVGRGAKFTVHLRRAQEPEHAQFEAVRESFDRG